MKAFAIFGFLLLSATCGSCHITKEQALSCASQTGVIQLLTSMDASRIKEEGPEAAVCWSACLSRHMGYINSEGKLDEAKILRDGVDQMDRDIWNVDKLREYPIACIRDANEEANECNVFKKYASCSIRNMFRFLHKIFHNHRRHFYGHHHYERDD